MFLGGSRNLHDLGHVSCTAYHNGRFYSLDHLEFIVIYLSEGAEGRGGKERKRHARDVSEKTLLIEISCCFAPQDRDVALQQSGAKGHRFGRQFIQKPVVLNSFSRRARPASAPARGGGTRRSLTEGLQPYEAMQSVLSNPSSPHQAIEWQRETTRHTNS